MRIAHVSWNLGGLVLPLLIAVATVPHLLRTLGAERFGFLALAWGLIGYASVLDLGIGRATTQKISMLRVGTSPDKDAIPEVLATAARITLFAGGVGAIAIALAAFLGVGRLINAKEIPLSEISLSILLLAFALPMQAMSATYKGVNEAYLNFRGISVVRVMLGAANFGLPFLISTQTVKLYWIVASLVISRASALLAYRLLANHCLSGLNRDHAIFSKKIAKDLVRFGGWFTLSSILNPMLSIADRFVIASAISAAAVSVYVIPYEMVVQSLVLVGAITTVAFPYISQLRVSHPDRVRQYFYKILLIASLIMAGVSLLYLYFGEIILSTWLRTEYSIQHVHVVKILSLGLIPYTIGTMCISLLHAYGKTNVTAKINLYEFLVYLILIYLSVTNFGLIGAGYAWVARVTINASILLIFANRRYE